MEDRNCKIYGWGRSKVEPIMYQMFSMPITLSTISMRICKESYKAGVLEQDFIFDEVSGYCLIELLCEAVI